MTAAIHGHEDGVDIILVYDVDLEQTGTVVLETAITRMKNKLSIENATYLWCASYWGHIGVVKLMLITQHAQLLPLSRKLAPNGTLTLKREDRNETFDCI